MGNIYKILWTDHALWELNNTYEYLELHFSETELQKLTKELDRTLRLIADNPTLFPVSDSTGIRKAVVKKFNTLYYREGRYTIEIISFFSNRQSPKRRFGKK